MTESILQQGIRQTFDVLVIGSGLAGVSYCLELLTQQPAVRIALITKKSLMDSNSRYAQGGIACATLPEDSLEQHVQDTLKAGDGLCDEETVRTILSQAPQAMQFLEKMGVQFTRQINGAVDLGQEGGHTFRRVFHIGDETGYGMMTALLETVRTRTTITVFEYHTVVNLITQIKKHTPAAHREVVGAYVLNEKTGLIDTFLAKVVVLATGGAGKVYRYTSNPDVAAGDGIAMAYRAGARVGNMEFYQFHPTLLHHPVKNDFLISEALRGEGGYLRRADTGERFMQRYAPAALEMATRDVVAQAIFNELEHSSERYVHLDMTHLDKDFLQQRFPTIYATLLSLGIDMSRDKIPVVPGAHYCCGGVLSNAQGETDIVRLFAIGETAFTGLHGANRLPCNSLLEAVVMGRLAAQASQQYLKAPLTFYYDVQDWNSRNAVDVRRASQINAHWRGLRGEMTSYAGIVRTKEGLKVLLSLINTRKEMIESYYWRHLMTRDIIELRNIVQIAELIARGALARHESRGGHYREDYRHTLSSAEETVFRNSREPRIKSTVYERPAE